MNKPTDLTFGDDRLGCTITVQQDAVRFTMRDKITGHQWPTTPLLVLEIYDRMCHRIDRLCEYRVDVIEPAKEGCHVVVGSNFHKVEVGLWLRVRGGELSVSLVLPEVYERNPDLFRLFALDLLPDLMAVGPAGTLLLPVDSGYQFSPANKRKCSDRFLIYGEQERWELLPNLPIIAAWEQGGLAALATRGAADAECRVATDGQGNGRVHFAVTLRQHWPDPVDFSTREIRYVPIPLRVNPLVFAAKRLRRHIIEDLGKSTLKQRVLESPQVAYMVNAYTMKLFYGMESEGLAFKNRGQSRPGTFVTAMTFSEAGPWLRRIREAGIDKVLTQSTGWNARGHDGMYPTRFPVDERLGGEAEFRELIALGHSLGYQMNVHDNYAESYRVSPDFDLRTTIRDLYGQPLVKGWWGGGVSYLQWPLLYEDKVLADEMKRVRELGIQGMYYVDGMPGPLECNYHPQLGGPRADHARGYCRIVKTARNIFGSCGIEQGFLHTMIPADYVVRCGAARFRDLYREDWPITHLLDRRVPLWQLAMHGLIVTESDSELSWRNTMLTVLYAEHPRVEWAVRQGNCDCSVMDESMIRRLRAVYDLCLVQTGPLQLEEMTHYHEPAENVHTTTYADGTEVTADFATEELTINGKPVARPSSL